MDNSTVPGSSQANALAPTESQRPKARQWRAEFDPGNPPGSRWCVRDRRGYYVCDVHDNGTDKGGDVGEAHAKLIAACVNACEGLPDGALDGGWTAKGLSAYAKCLEDTRDELSAALREAESALMRCEFAGAKTSDGKVGAIDEALIVVRAALAKVALNV